MQILRMDQMNFNIKFKSVRYTFTRFTTGEIIIFISFVGKGSSVIYWIYQFYLIFSYIIGFKTRNQMGSMN